MSGLFGRMRFFLVLSLLAAAALPAGVLAQEAAPRPETVCLQCHGGQTGRLGEPVIQWRGSVHQQNGISCHDCHGGDPTDFAMAMSPERGFLGVPEERDIPGFCGRCHVGVEEDYSKSAHGLALGSGGPQCVTCHGNHSVRQATPELINVRDCSRCHEYGRAEEIKAAVIQTDTLITALDDELRSLFRIGIATKEMQAEIFSLRNEFHRLFHSVDVDRVHRETAGFTARLTEIEQRIDAIEASLAQRKMVGGAVVGLLVVAGVLLLLLRRTYKEQEGGD